MAGPEAQRTMTEALAFLPKLKDLDGPLSSERKRKAREVRDLSSPCCLIGPLGGLQERYTSTDALMMSTLSSFWGASLWSAC